VNWHYLYLSLNIFAISIPLAASFYPKHNFSKKWRYLAPAILLPGAFFIAWDIWFTEMGIWGFNERYLTGITLFNLPLEEWLFFITIPYACVFTYEALKYLVKKDLFGSMAKGISYFLIGFLTLLAILHFGKWYTTITFLLLALYLLFHVVLFKRAFLGRFYFAFLFILVPFFLINGILTGSFIEEQVVWYNENHFMGLRLGTIPFEDTFYGMLLLLLNISTFEWLQEKVPAASTVTRPTE
jgi:lycopene cyclase domain-containing protein